MNFKHCLTGFFLCAFLFSCTSIQLNTEHQQAIINVADYNVIANSEDVTQALHNAIIQAKKSHAQKIIFPQGQYHFKSPAAVTGFDLLMSSKLDYDTPWGLGETTFNKSIAFNDLDNVTIDGQGSTLIFHGLTQAIELIASRNIVLKNFTIKWHRPLFSVGEVLSADGKVIKVKFNEDFPVSGDEPVWAYMDYNTQQQKLGTFDDWRIDEPMQWVSPQVLTINSDRKIPLGHQIIVRHVGNYRPAIHLVNSQDIHFENITILSAPGMGVIGHNCHNVSFNQLQVKPEKNHLMSTNTDATHFIRAC